MRVVVDGKLQPEFTAEHRKGMKPMREAASVESEIFSPDAAARAFALQQKTMFVVLGAIVLVLTTALSLLGSPDEQPLMLVVVFAANFALWVVLFVVLRRRLATFRADLPQRGSGVPPTGTRLRIDGAGLKVGDRLLALPSLRIDQVELSEHRARGVSIFLIERLSLATASEVVVLDSVMMDRGRLFTGNIWRRLTAT